MPKLSRSHVDSLNLIRAKQIQNGVSQDHPLTMTDQEIRQTVEKIREKHDSQNAPEK